MVLLNILYTCMYVNSVVHDITNVEFFEQHSWCSIILRLLCYTPICLYITRPDSQ